MSAAVSQHHGAIAELALERNRVAMTPTPAKDAAALLGAMVARYMARERVIERHADVIGWLAEVHAMQVAHVRSLQSSQAKYLAAIRDLACDLPLFSDEVA